MKKSLYLISLVMLLVVFFVAGTRFSQRGAPLKSNNTADRQILHYVDPMNPAHTTKEPGIAPCGMPMEPVYADAETANGAALPAAAAGTVKINQSKQQIIGVQVGTVTKGAMTSTIRALGRIVPDENRVYTLTATTEGWLQEINGATTGSLVAENQLLTQIKVYNYDFFTWQQRYLTELGYTSRINATATSISGGTDQSRRRAASGAGYQAGLPIPESEGRMIQRGAAMAQMATGADHQLMAPSRPAKNAARPNEMEVLPTDQADAQSHAGTHSTASKQPAAHPEMDHSAHSASPGREAGEEASSPREKNQLYASKGRLELLSLGVEESQLNELSESGIYITHVDVRAPVNGYVLTRKVSPLQKIENGTECFKIADLGRVWVEVDLYDSEAKHIQPGMEARISLPKQNEQFTATVSEVLPRFDAVSRSLKVRLETDNPELVFRPDMFIDVQFLIPLPEAITVPASAVIDSGKRKTVYVVMGEGVFEPREVATGWQTSERVEIAKGLQPGEKIVTSGNFLIDSESRMKLAAARLMEDKAAQPVQTQMPAVAEPAPRAAPTPAPHPTMPAADPQKTSADKVKDPVCGMTVNQDQATADGLTAEVDGKTYFFCSEDCKEQFKQDPQRFLTEKADKPVHTDAPAHGGHPHD